jgi:glucose/mannose-6-phosphate isomerase
MLDDLKYTHRRDATDALGKATKQWQALELDVETETSPIIAKNIVIAGTLAQALAALLAQSWPGYALPFEITESHVPKYVSAETYFIAMSYSGDDDSIIKATLQAAEQGAQIAVIAGGGKLHKLAREKHFSSIVALDTFEGFYELLGAFNALVTLLQKANLSLGVAKGQLTEAAAFMKSAVEDWAPTVPVKSNLAKQIALDCIGKSAVIYAGPKFMPAALRWQSGFHEQAKQIAWVGPGREFETNEYVGWTDQPVYKPYSVIELRSDFENPYILKRFYVSERLLSGVRPSPIIVNAVGDTLIKQLMWTIGLGDFTTAYTAIANGTDPGPASIIETFNKLMGE